MVGHKSTNDRNPDMQDRTWQPIAAKTILVRAKPQRDQVTKRFDASLAEPLGGMRCAEMDASYQRVARTYGRSHRERGDYREV